MFISFVILTADFKTVDNKSTLFRYVVKKLREKKIVDRLVEEMKNVGDAAKYDGSGGGGDRCCDVSWCCGVLLLLVVGEIDVVMLLFIGVVASCCC
jgi:hypothetical protein